MHLHLCILFRLSRPSIVQCETMLTSCHSGPPLQRQATRTVSASCMSSKRPTSQNSRQAGSLPRNPAHMTYRLAAGAQPDAGVRRRGGGMRLRAMPFSEETFLEVAKAFRIPQLIERPVCRTTSAVFSASVGRETSTHSPTLGK